MGILLLTLLALMSAAAAPQQIDLESLDRLAARAEGSTVIDLDTALIQLGSMFLSDDDKEESTAKNIIAGLDGIKIRVLEFDDGAAYTSADLDEVRSQLQGTGWARLISINEGNEEQVEVWAHRGVDTVTGLFVMVAEPDELVVVNLIGTIDLTGLRSLAGQFGIPEDIGEEIGN